MTHYWPADDDFADGTTVYGDYLSAYVKTAFWLSKSIAHPSTGSYTSTMTAADLTDLYATSPTGGPRQATPAGDPSGYLWRGIDTSSAVTVALGFQARALSGSAHTWSLAYSTALVGARVNGGTYTGATHKLENVQSGYFFGFLNDATRGMCWYLLRLNTGTITILGSTTSYGPFNFRLGNEIELRVTASGGDVRLVGVYRVASSDPASIHDDVTVFDYTDDSVSKLTGAGRCGFAMNGRRSITGGVVAPFANFFSVKVAGALALRDEWERPYRLAALASSDTVGSTAYSGVSMLQAFAGDFHGVAAFDKKIRRDQNHTGYVNFDPVGEPIGSGTGVGGFLASQRACTDPRSQHRKLSAVIYSEQYDGAAGTVDPSPYRILGIFTRGAATVAPSNSLALSAGYLASVSFVDGTGAATLTITRWSGGVPATIASATVTAAVSIDTKFELGLEVYNVEDSSGTNTGPVVIIAKIDTVQVVLVASGATGVTATAAGTVVDGSAARIIEGHLEGPYVWLNSGNRTIALTGWAEGALSNSLFDDSDNLASISVADEVADYSGQTFTVPYEWPVIEVPYDDTDAVRFESGHVRAGVRFTRGRRVWEIGAGAMDDDDRDDLLTFWAAHGCTTSFTFNPPDGEAAVKAHFLDSDLGTAIVDKGVNSFRIRVEELVDV